VAYVIGEALLAAGYLSSTIPDVLSIAVTFKNGDVAVYQHIQGQDIHSWKWGGKAWNALHQPIDRNGNVIGNPNTSGTGGGGGSGGVAPGFVWGFSLYSDCVFDVSESVPATGGVSGSEVTIVTDNYVPC
jgi:hypothetical protein